MRPFIPTLLILIALWLAGCSDEPRQDTFVYTDILTLVSYDSSTGSILSRDDATLSAPAFHPDTTRIHLGNRFLASYTLLNDNQIAVKGTATINNLSLILKPLAEVEQWDIEPVWLTSVTLDGGRYLNLRLKLPYDPEARHFYILADGADLYLIHRRDKPGDTFDRTYFASADLKPLTDAGISRVTLHVADKNSGTVTSLNFNLH